MVITITPTLPADSATYSRTRARPATNLTPTKVTPQSVAFDIGRVEAKNETSQTYNMRNTPVWQLSPCITHMFILSE